MIVVSMLLVPCQKALYASLDATKSSLCVQGVQSLHVSLHKINLKSFAFDPYQILPR